MGCPSDTRELPKILLDIAEISVVGYHFVLI
jgi:hypothetical protein